MTKGNKKYLVIADYITSKNDGDRHFITCNQLIRLYSVREEECICMENGTKRYQMYRDRYGDLIELRPKFDGDYRLPQKDTK
jgi:hypothetical protein